MGLLKIIESLSSVVDRVSKVIFGERNQRIRNKLFSLRKKRNEILKQKPSNSKASKIILINTKIKKLENRMENAK